MSILEIVPMAVGIALVTWLEWPTTQPSRCRVCGYLSETEVCSQPCQARLDMKVIDMETRKLHEMNFDKFGF